MYKGTAEEKVTTLLLMICLFFQMEYDISRN